MNPDNSCEELGLKTQDIMPVSAETTYMIWIRTRENKFETCGVVSRHDIQRFCMSADFLKAAAVWGRRR